MRDPQIDEPRLLVAGYDVDSKARRLLGPGQERLRIRRDTKDVGGQRTHGGRMQAAQSLAEACKACECGARGRGAEAPGPAEGGMIGAYTYRSRKFDCRADDAGRRENAFRRAVRRDRDAPCG